ncbi:MAG TPA: ACT domain-containing protein [Gaiellaceae bacterium]|jgi:hypothetical protein|nr:ACT domain-containing protein [Gaiellaceae bacterium]
MPKDLTVILEDRPGTLADLGEATGRAGINIDGLCGFPSGGKGVIHILVEDADAARIALEGAGLEVRDERDVLILRQGVDLVDRPGQTGEIMRRLADEVINVDLIYATWTGDAVVGADDLAKVRETLGVGEAARRT